MKKSKFYIICVVCLLIAGLIIWIGMENRNTAFSNTVVKVQKPEIQSYTLKKVVLQSQSNYQEKLSQTDNPTFMPK